MLDHAWAQSMDGQSTNVVAAFRAVIKGHPKTEQAHLANMWLADDAFNSGTNHLGAEKIYKSISSQTNAPVALRQRATLMAGRAAMARQGFGEARKEFTRLINDQHTPAPMKSEAHFALGDLTMLELGAAGLNAATNSFYNVVQASPTNAVAARAWGRSSGTCHFPRRPCLDSPSPSGWTARERPFSTAEPGSASVWGGPTHATASCRACPPTCWPGRWGWARAHSRWTPLVRLRSTPSSWPAIGSGMGGPI